MPFGNYWRKQAVGVLVAAPRPRAERVAEVEGYAGVDGEPDVLGHLLAAAGNAVPRAAGAVVRSVRAERAQTAHRGHLV
jgi:hypothetical protein